MMIVRVSLALTFLRILFVPVVYMIVAVGVAVGVDGRLRNFHGSYTVLAVVVA